MIFRTFSLLGIVLFTITAFSQSSIECDLLTLSQLTLDKSPSIKVGKLGIDRATANTKIQGSVFDFQLTSGASISQNKLNLFNADPRNDIINGKLETDNSDFSLGLQRKFRSGLNANLSIDYFHVSDNFPINRFNQDVGANVSDHTVSTTFSLTQPLLKGRGNRITTAAEKASKLNLESSENNYKITTSIELLQMGVAYWQYLSTLKSLKIYKENELRVRNVLQITQELVHADKKPAGDLIQIQADLANQERQTSIAEQNLHNARINLGRSIGLNEVESQGIGIPQNEFPVIFESNFSDAINFELLKSLAITNRTDLKAFDKTREALELQLSAAKNNLKPQLNLTGFINYGGMNMGNGIDRAFDALTNKQGSNYAVGLRLNLLLPLNNNLAKGSYLQSKTALSEQQVSYDDLERNINLNVSITFNNLEKSVSILEKASESLEYHKKVFSNEQEKFQNGLTTLLNLILFQERLTFAQLDHIRAQQQFAVAILNLRHETGTLITMENNNISAPSKDVFYEFPIIK